MEGREHSAVYPVDHLELRQAETGGRELIGEFVYNDLATIRDRGRVRKETIKPGAFAHTLADPAARVDLLVGHNYGKPVASRPRTAAPARPGGAGPGGAGPGGAGPGGTSPGAPSGGTSPGGAGPGARPRRREPPILRLEDTADALRFRAALPPEHLWPTWLRDALLSVEAGLMFGLSPGFKLPPATRNPNAETFIPDPAAPGVEIRVLWDLILFELSLVTRGAYQGGRVDVRSAEAVANLTAPPAREEVRLWL